MRFLLHPRTTTAAVRIASSSSSSKSNPIISSALDTSVTVTVGPTTTTTAAAAAAARTQSKPSTRAWGQQCSPNCGCVVRLEATLDSATQTFQTASYTAKRIVTTKTTTSSSSSSSSQQQQQRLQPVLTTKGRPMLQACDCQTVHYLAQAVVRHLTTSSNPLRLDQIKNRLAFSSHRSSAAFRRTVLKAQDLPRADTHCFDLLEDALTALVKGRLPKQRRISLMLAPPFEFDWQQQQQSESERATGNRSSGPLSPAGSRARAWEQLLTHNTSSGDWNDVHFNDDVNGDDLHDTDNAWQFGRLWGATTGTSSRTNENDYYRGAIKAAAARPGRSTLFLLDLANQEMAAARNRQGSRIHTFGPTDWVSYLDRLAEEEERSA